MVPTSLLRASFICVHILNAKTKCFLLSLRPSLRNSLLLCVLEPLFKMYNIAFSVTLVLESLVVWEIYLIFKFFNGRRGSTKAQVPRV